MSFSSNIITIYVCSLCGDDHESFYRAQECCVPEVETAYKCDICKDTFDSMAAIDDHLFADHQDEEVIDAFGLQVMSKAELEAAGQVRLFA